MGIMYVQGRSLILLSMHHATHQLLSLAHLAKTNRNIRGYATNVEQTVMTMVKQGNVLLYLLPISSRLNMKLTVGTSLIRGSLVRMKSDYAFVTLLSPKSDLILKLDKVSDELRKGSNWCPHRPRGGLVVYKYTAVIIKTFKM